MSEKNQSPVLNDCNIILIIIFSFQSILREERRVSQPHWRDDIFHILSNRELASIFIGVIIQGFVVNRIVI